MRPKVKGEGEQEGEVFLFIITKMKNMWMAERPIFTVPFAF